MNCAFGSSESHLVRYLNCQLNNVNFNATVLSDWTFEKSQLVNVCFGGSEVEDLTIKNSLLEGISFSQMRVCKNTISTTEEIRIQDYDSFLREFVK
jgi:uncharacterized protein YjbI with pentapeptide repeats